MSLRRQGVEKSFTESELTKFRGTFEHFDKDGSGGIDQDELTQVLRACGERATPEQAKEMIAAVDTDQDGVISWPEFLLMVKKLRSGEIKAKKLADVFGPGDLALKNNDVYEKKAKEWKPVPLPKDGQRVADVRPKVDTSNRAPGSLGISKAEFMKKAEEASKPVMVLPKYGITKGELAAKHARRGASKTGSSTGSRKGGKSAGPSKPAHNQFC